MSWFSKACAPARLATCGLIALASVLGPSAAVAQQLSIVSMAPGGNAAGALAEGILAMTPDEQYVAFCSAANSLDPARADTNGLADVYRRHLPTGVTTLVSVNAAGTGAGNGGCPTSNYVRISVDGRYVAFLSEATNLVNGITDATTNDVFVRDLQTGTTSLASVTAAGTTSAGTTAVFDFSDDGRYVVFQSYAATVVAGFVDGNGPGNADLYRRDRQAGTTALVSASTVSATQSGDSDSSMGSENFHTMSADGRYIAFLSSATNLVAGHVPLGQDLYVRDLQAGTTVLGDDANPAVTFGLTADGRWLVFTENSVSIWVRDLQTNARVRVSVNALGTGEGNSVSNVPFISRLPKTPGQQDYVVGFRSLASDLVSGVTKANPPGSSTIYARTLGGSTVLVGGIPNGTATGNGDDFIRDISPDGRYIIFTSTSTNIVQGLTDTIAADLFRRDLTTNTTTILTAAQPSGVTGVGFPLNGRVGQNGGAVFHTAAGLLPADTNNNTDLYFSGAIPAPSISGTVTASGGAALAGVTLTLTGTSGGTATTGAPGTYAFTSLTANGSYTVTPSAAGFTFAPASRSFANIAGGQTADFVGTAAPVGFSISGQVRDLNDTGVADVVMTLSGSASATRVTDIDGLYAFTGLAAGRHLHGDAVEVDVHLRATGPDVRQPAARRGGGLLRGQRRHVHALLRGGLDRRLLRHHDRAPERHRVDGRRHRKVPEAGRDADDTDADDGRPGPGHGRSRAAARHRGRGVRDRHRIDAADHLRPADGVGQHALRQPRRDQHRPARDDLVSRRRRDDRLVQPVLPAAESARLAGGGGRDPVPAAGAAPADREDLQRRTGEPAHDLRERRGCRPRRSGDLERGAIDQRRRHHRRAGDVHQRRRPAVRRRSRERRHPVPRHAVVPRRGRDGAVLPPVHPRGQPQRPGRADRRALPEAGRQRGDAALRGVRQQPPHDWRPRRRARAGRDSRLDDGHVDQRRPRTGRARDVVAGDRAGMVPRDTTAPACSPAARSGGWPTARTAGRAAPRRSS